MLRAVPRSLFSWDFTVYEDDTAIADIDVAWFREKGELKIKGVDCQVYREGLFSGAFVLEAGGHRLIEAVKPSAFYRSFDVTYDDRQYTLKAKSALARTFLLQRGDEVIGTVSPEGVLTRKLTADLPGDLPLAVRVFIIWLVILLWKRAAEAASG